MVRKCLSCKAERDVESPFLYFGKCVSCGSHNTTQITETSVDTTIDILANIDLSLLSEQIDLLSEMEVDMALHQQHREAISGVLNLLGPLHHALETES